MFWPRSRLRSPAQTRASGPTRFGVSQKKRAFANGCRLTTVDFREVPAKSSIDRPGTGPRDSGRYRRISLPLRLALAGWLLHGDHHPDHHRLPGDSSAVEWGARVQPRFDLFGRGIGVSRDRGAHAGFARIRAAQLLWQATNGT